MFEKTGIPSTEMIIKKFPPIDRINTVSYTHLDVYKRQMLVRPERLFLRIDR